MQKALEQIAQITEALNKIRTFGDGNGGLAGLLGKLDVLTAEHTCFKTFTAMVHGTVNLPPYLRKAAPWVKNSESWCRSGRRNISFQQFYAELDLLALCYDMAQEARGDSRRAFRS